MIEHGTGTPKSNEDSTTTNRKDPAGSPLSNLEHGQPPSSGRSTAPGAGKLPVGKKAPPLITGPRKQRGLASSRQAAGLAKLCERLKREIKERRKAQVALGKQELHFRTLVETMNSGLIILDERGVITYVNNKLLDLTGYDRSRFLGRPINEILDMIRTTNRAEVLEELEKRKTGRTASYEVIARRTDGAKLNVLVSPRPLHDEKGVFRGSFAVVTDITGLKAAEERLRIRGEQLQSLSSQLLAAEERERRRMSVGWHADLGQALVALKLSAKFIRMRVSCEQDNELCEHCLSMAKLADEIIQKFPDLCGDLSPLVIEDLGLSSALRSLLEDFARCHGIICHVDVDELSAHFDAEAQIMIYRVLQECLNNVLRHAAASRVSLSFKRIDDRALFRIEDDGVGFPDEPPRNGTSSSKKLGLIAMRERVRMLGGSLEIESARGATSVSFSVPLQT